MQCVTVIIQLGCRCLETVRNPVLHELVTKLKECDIDFWQLNETKKIQLILDSTIGKTRKITSASAQRVELHSTSDFSTPYYKIQSNLGSEVII
jgi:hypothetical protein